MVAKITSGRSISAIVRYNEHKVAEGDARSLGSVNGLTDGYGDSVGLKTRTLTQLADRNTRTKRNAFHIALSFAPGDELDDEKAREIAQAYLKGIGFGSQPAYVYRHHDTANDHIHLVTTNIDRAGQRIDDSFIGAVASEKARKALEIEYDLVPAQDPTKAKTAATVNERIESGVGAKRSSLKAYARATVKAVFREAKPTSVAEANALLRAKGVRLVEHVGTDLDGQPYRGYSVTRIDSSTGQPDGRSVKASKIFGQGWSGQLGDRLAKNERVKSKAHGRVRDRVSSAFTAAGASSTDLPSALSSRGLSAIEHRNAAGRLYGVHYVCEETGCIYKASEIGRAYSAKSYAAAAAGPTAAETAVIGELQRQLRRREREMGWRSPAIGEFTRPGAAEALAAAAGYDTPEGRAAAKWFATTQKAGLAKARKRDETMLAAFAVGVNRLAPSYRAEVLRAGGVEEAGGGYRLAPAAAVPEGSVAGVGGKAGPRVLSPAERDVVIALGRGAAAGTLRSRVHAGAVDWSFWGEAIPPEARADFGTVLHERYLEQTLSRAERSRSPLAHATVRGIVLAPAGGGAFAAYVAGASQYVIPATPRLTAQAVAKKYDGGLGAALEKLLIAGNRAKARELLREETGAKATPARKRGGRGVLAQAAARERFRGESALLQSVETAEKRDEAVHVSKRGLRFG